MLAWRPRRPDQAVLASLLVFISASVGAGNYVLNHLGDGRWGGDAQSKLTAPYLSGAPVVGDFLEPLEGALGGMADGVNEFIDFRSALPVALDYFGAAGWALAAAVPAGLLVLVVNAGAARRRNAEFARHSTELLRLRAELESVKRHVGYPADDII
ncbi:hypothetical protein [Arthrobacter sp. D3-16]